MAASTFALSISDSDPLSSQKKAIIEERGLKLVHDLVASTNEAQLDTLLEVARIVELNEVEIYFLEDEDRGPFSPRNEAEALWTVRTLLRRQSVPEDIDTCNLLEAAALRRLDTLGPEDAAREEGQACTGEPEQKLLEWARWQGVKARLVPAVFESTGRGAAADQAFGENDMVLQVPRRFLLCADTALASDMGPALRSVEGLDPGATSLLWSMRERSRPDSLFEPYFASLPQSFNTGLSMGPAALAELHGLQLLEEIIAAREYLQGQYAALFPALSDAMPEWFPLDSFTWPCFLWAAELWYSHGLRVQFPDGSSQTCLVPLAGLLNHSIYPHVTHYSKLDESSQTLLLRSLRSCGEGEQCFLSYGPLGNADLLMFYGFVLTDNPYDTIPFDIEIPDGELREKKLELLERNGLGLAHMLRACSGGRGIATRLLAAFRVIAMDANELANFSGSLRLGKVSDQNEAAALELLASTVDSLLEPLIQAEACSSYVGGKEGGALDDDEPGMAEARAFRVGTQKLLESVQQQCALLIEKSRSATPEAPS